MAVRLRQDGPGFDAFIRAWRTVPDVALQAIGQTTVRRIQQRAFGPGGRGSDGRPHPPGRDLVESGRTRAGVSVVFMRPRRIYIGVRGVRWADDVQARTPFLALTDDDRASIAPTVAPAIARALDEAVR